MSMIGVVAALGWVGSLERCDSSGMVFFLFLLPILPVLSVDRCGICLEECRPWCRVTVNAVGWIDGCR